MTLGIMAGRGELPALIVAAHPGARVMVFAGVGAEPPPGSAVLPAEFERLGQSFADLRAAGVTEVVMAGAMDRPRLDPARLDPRTAALAPGLVQAMRQGDDALLRHVVSIYEAEGFAVRGVAEVLPDLVAAEGALAGPEPDAAMRADAARGWAILDALGPLDVGQAAVVARGVCLGIETIQGTDALIALAGATPAEKRPPGGVLVKGPKPGQELRVDMPAIGPETVEHAAAAGLKGIALAAGGVLVLDRAEVAARAGALGLSLWAEPR